MVSIRVRTLLSTAALEPIVGKLMITFFFIDVSLKSSVPKSVVHAGLVFNNLSYYAPYSSKTIPYRLDTAYTSMEKMDITAALTLIQDVLPQCLTFIAYDPVRDAAVQFMDIARVRTPLSVPYCFANTGATTNGVLAQNIYIVPSDDTTKPVATGCLDSKRSIMGILTNSLGVVDEISRPDRDMFVKINTDMLLNVSVSPNDVLLQAYGAYTVGQVNVLEPTIFDFKSITMHAKSWNAKTGMDGYTTKNAGEVIGDLPALSLKDCQAIALLYNCDLKKCVDPYMNPAGPLCKGMFEAGTAFYDKGSGQFFLLSSKTDEYTVLMLSSTGILMVPTSGDFARGNTKKLSSLFTGTVLKTPIRAAYVAPVGGQGPYNHVILVQSDGTQASFLIPAASPTPVFTFDMMDTTNHPETFPTVKDISEVEEKLPTETKQSLFIIGTDTAAPADVTIKINMMGMEKKLSEVLTGIPNYPQTIDVLAAGGLTPAIDTVKWLVIAGQEVYLTMITTTGDGPAHVVDKFMPTLTPPLTKLQDLPGCA